MSTDAFSDGFIECQILFNGNGEVLGKTKRGKWRIYIKNCGEIFGSMRGEGSRNFYSIILLGL